MLRTTRKGIALVLLVSVTLAASGVTLLHVTLAAPAVTTSVGSPLPLTCSGIPTPARCLYGYVYYGDTPVSDASVKIDSLFGSETISTTSGGLSTSPYFQTSLSGSPLLVQVGDTITLTANYNGRSATTVYVVAPGGQQADVVIAASPIFGNGADGDLTVSSNTDMNPVRATAAGIAGSNVLTISMVTGSGFQPNQLVMIHQTRGTNSGQWELRTIALVGSSQLTLTSQLSNTYATGLGADRAQVVWVPQYRNVTISGAGQVTPSAWDGNTGGIIVFLSSATTNIVGTIDATAKGFRGDKVNGSYNVATGQGEGTAGDGGTRANSSNGNGGGGSNAFSSPWDNGSSGAGGGNGTSGGNGVSSRIAGSGGATAGDSSLANMVFGGGGAHGSDDGTGGGATIGLDGGGAILIATDLISVTGSIESTGQTAGSSGGSTNGGGGGGAGGSILIKARVANLGSGAVSAPGGSGNPGHNVGYGGGSGGVGRIRLEYYENFSGSTNPVASAQQVSLSMLPIPTINTLYPTTIVQGSDVITLRGSADSASLPTASISSYVWRDENSNVLGTQASFTLTAASFSVGVHTIYFKAMDSNNLWSDEISRTLTIQSPSTVTPTATVTPTPTATATSTRTPTATPRQAFLPVMVRNYTSYFPGTNEVEPNNTAAQANGPLQSGVDYHGYPNDDKDYFSFFLPDAGNITADLSNNSGLGTQLLLYYQIADVAHRVDFVAGAPFHIARSNQPAGWYYLEVFTAGAFNSSTPYTLRVTYP